MINRSLSNFALVLVSFATTCGIFAEAFLHPSQCPSTSRQNIHPQQWQCPWPRTTNGAFLWRNVPSKGQRRLQASSEQDASTSGSQQERWNQTFERLLVFRQEHGHVQVPNSYNDGKSPHLGIWVNSQRRVYKKSPTTFCETRAAKLEAAGFTWSFDSTFRPWAKVDSDVWDDTFQRLQIFKQKFGHANVPLKYNDGVTPHLGEWISRQRRVYKIYQNTKGRIGGFTEEKLMKLESLGFQWTDRTRKEERDERWMAQFEAMKSFKHKYNTTKINIGVSDVNSDINSVLTWGVHQRQLYNQLISNKTTAMTVQKRVDLLDSIDFAWDMQNKTDHDKWIHRYFKVYWHHVQFNNTDISTANGHNSGLVRWISKQKENYHAGKLDQGKIDLLDELDFDWTMDPEFTWEELFEKLSQYHARYNSTLINSNIDGTLGSWTTELRKLYAAGHLDPKWAARLNSLDFQWYATNDVNWNAMLDRLVAYKRRYGNTCVPPRYKEDESLSGWVGYMRNTYAEYFELDTSKVLTDENLQLVAEKLSSKRLSAGTIFARLKKLCDIGFVWNALEAQWLEMYAELKKYKEENGSADVPAKGSYLGKWVSIQRYRVATMSDSRRQLLDEIGFEWDPLEARWTEMFLELCKYKARHGDAMVLWNNGELGSWLSAQRKAYKEKTLSGKRIEMLESIGVVWSILG